MPKGYISNRQKNLKIGISSYTESNTVLEVTGKVGIGTTNAGASLQVTPSSTSIAGLFSGSTSKDLVRITQEGSGNALVVEDSTNSDSSPFVVTSTGNVGLGTTNPAEKLFVDGDVRITGVVTVGRSSITIDGENNVINVGTGVTIHHSNGIQIGENIIHSSGLTINNLNVTGVSTFSNGPVLIGSSTTTGTASQKFQVTGGAYVSGDVGIGTTNPTQSLDVTGNVRITGGIFDKDNSSGTDTYVPVADGIGGWSWQPVTAAGAGVLDGITIKEEGSTVGTAGSVTFIDFIGAGVTATASGVGATITFTQQVGPQGVQGTEGIQGIQGIQGPQGIQGIQGPVAGSANQVVYKDGFNNPAGSGNLTFDGANLYVGGNITIGGTTALIAATRLEVNDKDIVVGLATTAGGIVISNDTTANHGGIAVASTEGSPLIDINAGLGTDDIPSTYKQLMWIKAGTFTGLNTDAWVSNYAIGVGTFDLSYGVRFAAGGLRVTDSTVSSPQLNISGVSTLGVTTTTDLYAQKLNVSNSIGIGTTNPVEKLFVDGDARITGILTVGSSSITLDGQTNLIAVGSGVIIHHSDGIQIGGNVIHSSGLSINNLNVSGVSTFYSGPVLIGSSSYTGTASQPLQITGGTYVSGDVGIGITNPTVELDVVGDGKFTGFVSATTYYQNGVSLNELIGNRGLEVKNEGVGIGTSFTAINFVGASVTATASGTTAIVTIDEKWIGITTTYTASSNLNIIADTSAGTYTVTLPPSPGVGDVVKLADGGDWGVNNLTIGRNGNTIEGFNQDFILDVSTLVTFIYDGTTWQVYSQVGPQGIQGVQGTQGIQGIQGLQGLQGVQGPQGTQGVQGLDGLFAGQGVQGIQGPQGVQGTQGIQGFSFARQETTFVATAGQQIFSVNYVAGTSIDVYLNGIRLSDEEYSAVSGSNVILTVGASAGDILDVVVFESAGPQGPPGIQGPDGPQGIQGPQGPQGVQGVQGQTFLGIATANGIVGSGITLIDFRGSGISTVTVSAGIGTVNVVVAKGTQLAILSWLNS